MPFARSFWMALIVCAVSHASSISAQQAAQISGSVVDQTGAGLAGATVVVQGRETWHLRTDSSGDFVLAVVPPGDYELSVTHTGFDTVRRALTVQPGEALSLSLTLSVAFFTETVVTAARTGDADAQSLPIAVSAVSGNQLERLATRTIEQAVPLLPSVTFTQNSTFGQVSIRGIGTNLVNAGGDPSTAIYLDGVYLARPAMAFIDLLDLERIEVLRGPQGTLYGRNALGGALQLISRRPTNDFEASARLTAGTFGELRGEARLSGPLKRDALMGTIAIVRGSRDGYVRDLNQPTQRLGGDDLTGARGQLRAVLRRNLDLLVAGDVGDQRGVPLTFNKVLAAKPGVTIDNPPDRHEVRTSAPASAQVLQYGASARLSAALTPFSRLVSLTAWRRLENEFLVDGDVTELDLLIVRNRELQSQWSQEVTLAREGTRVGWIAGTFLMRERDHQTVHASQTQARAAVVLDPRVTARSAALFGETTVGVTPSVSAILGLRYSRESKTIDNSGGRYTLDTPSLPISSSAYGYADSIAHTAWTPKFGMQLDLSSHTMAYVSATKGFKSGGFNWSSTVPGRGFAPESAWSYEGGLKTQLGSGRARINVAAFTMDYTNLQVQTPIGIGVFDIRNAAAATIRGLEFEAASRLGRGFDAGGHLTWLDAAYDNYVAVATGGVTADVAGHRLNNAPEFAGRMWVEWNGTLGDSHTLTLAADATAQSTVFFTPFNDAIERQPPYALLGAQAEFGPSHRRWSVNVHGRNLTDTGYIMATFATSPAAYGGRPGAARAYGAQLVLRR